MHFSQYPLFPSFLPYVWFEIADKGFFFIVVDQNGIGLVFELEPTDDMADWKQ